MRIFISGILGFVGRNIAEGLLARCDNESIEILGMDNFSRVGVWENYSVLSEMGVFVKHGDVREREDLEGFGKLDWIIDASANPSVLAGIDGNVSSRSLVQHNLHGTVNLLELCKDNQACFTLISTSRVFSIEALSSIQVEVLNDAFIPRSAQIFPNGVSQAGIAEHASTQPPLSLYGVTKSASESLVLEYSYAFDFPVWINRCGVLSGAGQFGRIDQGIFSFWIHSWLLRKPLSYIGFGGAGYQVRDCLHPMDLAGLFLDQYRNKHAQVPRVYNLGGGTANSLSLANLSSWCAQRFGPHEILENNKERQFDLPWIVMDSSLAKSIWNWKPTITAVQILEEIALHAETHPGWLDSFGK